MNDLRDYEYTPSPIMRSIVYPKYYSKETAEKDVKIITNHQFSDVLTELVMMISSQDPYCPIGISDDLTNELRNLMIRLRKKGGTVYPRVKIDSESRLTNDGYGPIYCGRAMKQYKVGDKLQKKMMAKICHILFERCDFFPAIMFSKCFNRKSVDGTEHTVEAYYYFHPDYKYITGDNGVSKPVMDYICDRVLDSDQQILGISFTRYMITQLDNVVYCPNIKWYYGFETNDENSRKWMENMPMGTIVKFADCTKVKASPMGSAGFISEYNGAIEI